MIPCMHVVFIKDKDHDGTWFIVVPRRQDTLFVCGVGAVIMMGLGS